MSAKVEEGSLLARTRELLLTCDQSYLTIYLATGLKPNWLSKLAQARLPDPSVNKVQKLYEHLTATKLIKAKEPRHV